MSKAAKQSIIILIVLLFAAVGFSYLIFSQKQSIVQKNQALQNQVTQLKSHEADFEKEKAALVEQLAAMEKAKQDAEERLNSFDTNIVSLDEKVKKMTAEREGWSRQVADLSQERDQLLAKMQEKPKTELIYKYITRPVAEPQAQSKLEIVAEPAQPSVQEQKPLAVSVDDDSFWAGVLKEKASLEVEVSKLKDQMSKANVELVEMKKKNSDLQLEMSELQNKKEEIERDIKYANDLADTLALELARAKNDKKFVSDRLNKMNEENQAMRGQIRQLSSTKIALEKSMVHLQGEKKDVERRLAENESVIQNRIDEIWGIKESLDNSFRLNKSSQSSGGGVSLPPIVVSQNGLETPKIKSQTTTLAKSEPDHVGFAGNVVSVNDENNFVIVDIGEGEGIQLGDKLNVYRGPDYIAGLEVIQVRKDIAAADIKNKVIDIQVGDNVK